MTIGERIREARTAKGLTQEQLAEQVHVTKQAVYKYETGIVTNIPLDKLESIPGCSVEETKERFVKQVQEIGCAVIGQTHDLCPADKALYALRDVTGTVNCIPLIASSIVSKKLASGAGAIVLDVKTGSGALMRTVEDSIALAKAMVDIGAQAGKPILALVTGMEQPLGTHVGNACLLYTSPSPRD